MIHMRNFWIIPLTLLIAMMLMMLPLPPWARPFRPDWLSMVTLYWVLAVPRVVGIGVAWLLGLLLDVAYGTLLGQHAVGLALITYLALRHHQRIRVAPLGQMGLVIMLLLLVKQSVVLWVDGFIGRLPDNILLYFVPSALAVVLWPWAFIILRDLRRRYRLS
jgi:rod shape-determining protein MreD